MTLRETRSIVDRWSTFITPHACRVGIGLALFCMVCSYCLARYSKTRQHPLRYDVSDAEWIACSSQESQVCYLRKKFQLSGEVRHAWLRIAAEEAFEVSVNRNPMGHLFLWRPTRPFQTGLSDKGQVLLPQAPAMALNFPREYQWSGHASWTLPTFVDLTNAFVPGENVIAIEIESRSRCAKVQFEGEIVLWSGQRIAIRSNPTWQSSDSLPGPQIFDWTELGYNSDNWPAAQIVSGPTATQRRSHPREIFVEPFQGQWIRHPSAGVGDAVSFVKQWQIEDEIDEAWLRVVSNRPYELLINQTPVRVASARPPDMDHGDWVFGRGTALDPVSKPELLDPDEVASSFVGKRFENPRNAAPGLDEFIHPFSPQITPFRYERTHHRAQDGGVFEPKRTLADSRRTPETADLYPERPRPNALKRERSTGGFLAYSIAPLLTPGTNTIEVRCSGGNRDGSWVPQIALDAGVKAKSESLVTRTRTDTQWKCVNLSQIPSGEQSAAVIGNASATGEQLPRMEYRGNAVAGAFGNVFLSALLQVGSLVFGSVGLFFAIIAWRHGLPSPAFRQWTEKLLAMTWVATVTLICAALLECGWYERHEVLLFLDGSMWRFAFALTIVAVLATACIDSLGRLEMDHLRSSGHRLIDRIRTLPHTSIWPHLLLWILLLATLARAYKLDMQPLDDDEYASTQAILSILETGTPAFEADGVYYTRSPLYHYVTALVALPFGGNLWSLRLQSVFWGVATCLLAYRCGAKLLGDRWVGMLCMLLVAVHPFEIFTGHVIRFYQMQQFFALLTVYWFCRGFVQEQRQGFRIATLAAFLCAVLSQEITVAIGPSLVLCYVLFAKDLGWSKNIELIVYSMIVVLIIFLDYLAFQTLCLTRTEGVSPTIEASIKPHFWYPLNFLSLLIGYSRLHIVPTVFLILGMPLMWRERNRSGLAILVFLVSGVVLTNLLVTNVSLRYLYWLFPIWLLLAVYGTKLLISFGVSQIYDYNQSKNRFAASYGIAMATCVACILASWSLWRVPQSYDRTILGDSTAAVRWIRSQQRDGDLLAITEPHTHCAFIEAGHCDYDIAVPLLYDFAVMQDGRLVDRNGAGEVVSNLDQLMDIFARGERVWIALNREKFRTRGKNMRWEYPGARFESFVRQNCQLAHRTYLWSVFLWDPAQGRLRSFQRQQ